MSGPIPEVVIELSWEVCNPVGGIHTVVSSKAAHTKKLYEKYICVGPYFHDKAIHSFQEETLPDYLKGTIDRLHSEGIHCHYGTWLIKGEPKAILIEYRDLNLRANEFKAKIWEKHKIDSMSAGWDFSEPLVWSYGCARLLEEMKRESFAEKKMVSHHHEWLAGLSLLLINENIPTLFTTHATMLGRSMASRGEDISKQLKNIDPYAKAKELGIIEKHLTEVACAKESTVFTTVSEITGEEAEQFLGRKPEILLLNGIDSSTFPTIEETSIKHVNSREVLREFQTYHFSPYYKKIDLKDNLMFCISGRYEYENKGIDLFVESLARLNNRLREEGSTKTITAFFWLLMGELPTRAEVIENKQYYQHVKKYVNWHDKEIKQHIINHFITSENPAEDECMHTKEFMKEMKRNVLHFKRGGNPPVCTHNINNQDTLINALHHVGLDNREDNPVKIVVFPSYLGGNDGLIDLDYYEAVAGCHYAIFPSYYEPWGYTPLESAALGVPTLTTDLAGFGKFVKDKTQADNPGVFVLERAGRTHEDVANRLYERLYTFSQFDHAQRVQNKINAKQLSKLADWDHLIKNYQHAYQLALKPKEE